MEIQDAVIISAVRTPIGRATKGSLREIRADDLATVAVRAATAAATAQGLDPALVEDVIMGCAFPEGEQGMNLARIVGLLAGLPEGAGATTVNRFCASSLQAINMAAGAIMLGQGEAIVAGGVEAMSRVPMGGFTPSYNPLLMPDRAASPAGGCSYPDAYIPMGMTAENLARRYGISREEQDAYALRSHQKAVAAMDAGRFAAQIVPVTLPDGRAVDADDGPRRDTSIEKLAALAPAFRPDGTVTAGNASPLNDGAAACVLVSGRLARSLGLRPLARIRSVAVAGVAPEIMGIGPVPATRKALDRAGLTLGDIEVVELNEAFAVQNLAVIRDLGLDQERLNPNGGALALGHPLGCSGARIMTALVHELRERDGTFGLATLCVGGGQGVATIVERLS